MKPAKVRLAKPSANLQSVARFYIDGLGLDLIGSFVDHDGYDGLLVGKHGCAYEFEFTYAQHAHCQMVPSKDFLLVFYIEAREEAQEINNRMMRLGYRAVEPLNPYWIGISKTYEDPDGWRVVIFDMQARGLKDIID